MKLNAVYTTAVLALLLAGVLATVQRDYSDQSLDLLRLLATKPWMGRENQEQNWGRRVDMDLNIANQNIDQDDDDNARSYLDDELRVNTDKRSAVATALNSGRRRRQPTPALGKAVTSYVGVGVLNDVSSFFDSLRNNLETIASLSPEQRSTLFQEPPTVIHAPSSGGGGGGNGIGNFHPLRLLRPSGNIRTYNRRSFIDTEYPKANHHDPALLWAGLGR